MSAIRQDAWSEDEDLLLAETVLRHIREGSTQLVAFEEVGKALSRTSAACGFRWNSLVRKKYEEAILLAKKQRKELQNQKKLANKKNRHVMKPKKTDDLPVAQPKIKARELEMDLEQVMAFLNKLKENGADAVSLREENEQLRNELELERKRAAELEDLRQQALKDYEYVKSEYQTLLSIMDKARKLADAGDTLREPEKVNK
ncbi:MAG: RsfA family transcriptional regulator [Tuberibacillus sp.]